MARSPHDQEHYVAHHLNALLHCVEPLVLDEGTESPFAEVCHAVESARSFEEVARRLSLPAAQQIDGLTWLRWTYQSQLNPLVCLYTACVQLATPVFDREMPEGLYVPRVFIADKLRMLGFPPRAVELSESYLKLVEGDYGDGAAMRAALDRSAQLTELGANSRATLLRVLAEALGFVSGRGSRQAARLLESYLKLDEGDYRDGAAIRAALDRSAELAELEANSRGNFLRVLADALGFVSGRGHEQAARLLESYLKLNEGDYRDGAAMRAALNRSVQLAELEANNRATFLRVLAGALGFVAGRGSAQAARLLESYLDLDERDYRDGPAMRAALDRSARLAELEANNRANFLQVLASALLFVRGRGHVQAARLLESHLKLDEGDYRDGAAMRAGLDRSPQLAELEANNRAMFLQVLADALGFVSGRGQGQAARLLESYLTLDEGDYRDGAAMRAALDHSAQLTELTANNRAAFLTVLANALGFVDGRGRVQAARLLESYLKLDEGDYRDGAAMRAALDRSAQLAELEANTRTHFLQVLASALGFVSGRGRVQAARLLESYLELDEGDYRDGATMRAALDRSAQLAELEANNRANVLQVVASALGFVRARGSAQAARLLESYLELDESDYRDGAAMRAALDRSARLAELEANNRAGFVQVLADALRAVRGRGSAHAVRLLESHLELDEGDYRDGAAMRAALDRSSQLAELEANNRVNFLHVLGDGLGAVSGRGSAHAARLLESLVGAPMFCFATAAPLRNVEALNCLGLLNIWLKSASGHATGVFETARAVVQFIRDLREDVLPTYEHRRDFLAQARNVWNTVQRVAIERIAQERRGGPEGMRQAEHSLREFLYWGEQLHNRLLVERLFVAPHRLGGEGTASLGSWEPWRQALLPPAGGPDDLTIRQEWQAARADRSGTRSLCLRAEPGVSIEAPSGELVADDEAPRELRRQLLAPAGKEPELHELIPLNAVWVRALLDDEGCLRWWAWRREQDQLRLLDEGLSRPDAKRELEVANLRFDLEVERCWAAYEGATLEDLQDEDALLSLIQDVNGSGEEPAAVSDPAPVGAAVARLGRYAPRLAELGTALLTLASEDDPEATVETWMVEEFRAGIDVLCHPWGASSDLDARDMRRRATLDEASRRHLAAFQQHFQIGSLWSKLPPAEWAQTDILFQVPGPLLVAPLAWLEFGPGTGASPSRLQACVASTSTVISLTLRQQAEREAREQTTQTGQLPPGDLLPVPARPKPRGPVRRVLSVHWDEPKRRNSNVGIYGLQQKVIAAGRDRGWEVWCLGDQPKATAQNLQAAINDPERRFGVLLVNGHGVRETYGIKLADDSQWCGEGTDLRDTDLVFLAACSVGRLQEDGSHDLEGLYAELAAHHGRTVIAARWPIADTETASLAHAVLREYLDLAEASAASGTAPPPFARARALSRVRRQLLAEGRATFHLAAAFEIYGLG